MAALEITVLPVTPFQQNCALIRDPQTGGGVVVDPGGEVPRILAGILELGMRPDMILLTHGHIDHAGGAAGLKDELRARGLDVPVIGPDERDRFILDGLEAQGRTYGIAGTRSVVPDRWLAEGQEIAIAGHAFEVLHCPGHTPGSLVYHSPELRFALVGDVLFKGSVGRTDFAYGDHDALIEAITTKLLPLPDETTFLCGHGPGSTIGEERRTNPYVGLGARR